MRMVDISKKIPTERTAIAMGAVYLKAEVAGLIRRKKVPKGDVLEASRIAGILGAKKTSEMIPLCHPIPIEFADLEFSVGKREVKITAEVRTFAKTGVEMEALTAVSMAALTIYDMCKPLDKGITISDIRLVKKTGGKSGKYVRVQGSGYRVQ